MERSYDDRMSDALAELDLADRINYTATAVKHDISRHALSRRHQGKSTSRKEVNSTIVKALSNSQEAVLVERISALSLKGCPMTPQVVRDLAERIARRPLGKCWTQRFVQRHLDTIESVYLKPIDKKRKWAESIAQIKAFYQLVLLSPVLLMNSC